MNKQPRCSSAERDGYNNIMENSQENLSLNEVLFNNRPCPEDARSFNDRLKKEFGCIGDFPRFRVVWGQDERYKVFQSGKPRLPYVLMIQRITKEIAYQVMQTNGQIKRLTFNQMRTYTPKFGEVIIPNTETYEKEIGIPFWFLEHYNTPEMLGSEDEWNAHRFFDGVDLTGVYPRNGRYHQLVELSGLDSDGNLTEYMPLNDATFHYIQSLIKGDKPTIEEARRRKAAEFDNLWDEIFDEKLNREMYDRPKKPIYFLPKETTPAPAENKIITL